MRYSKSYSCGIYGIKGVKVEIEVSLLPGLSIFEIVGLGDSAIRESRDRVHAAIKNSGYKFPSGRVIVGMAPGFIRKTGTSYDLAIALGILAASGQIPKLPSELCVVGELSLSGQIRKTPGIAAGFLTAASEGFTKILIPLENRSEVIFAEKLKVFAADSLRACVDLLENGQDYHDLLKAVQEPADKGEAGPDHRDMASIVGQAKAVMAAMISATGWHNLFLSGSPGCGKTSVASAIPGILPPLGEQEIMEVAMIHSSINADISGICRGERPFRSPHHTISPVAMSGGGHMPLAGELSLAHKGVLFLDEITHFKPVVLEILRQPLEEYKIRIRRQKYSYDFPADFILVAASNPCKCGQLLEIETEEPCKCPPSSVARYLAPLSGALLDRIDLFADLKKLPPELLEMSVRFARGESDKAREEVKEAWERQAFRCKKHGIKPVFNSRLQPSKMDEVFGVDDAFHAFAGKAIERLELSVRGYQKLLAVARSLADLEGTDKMEASHFASALQFRRQR